MAQIYVGQQQLLLQEFKSKQEAVVRICSHSVRYIQLLDEEKPVPACVPKVRVHPRGGADRDPAPRPEGATVAEVAVSVTEEALQTSS